MIDEQPRFQGLKLSELLRAASREAWFTDPERAIEAAELAVAVASRLDVDVYGTSLTEEARAMAWAYLGNAYRISSDLRRAEEALQRADEHFRQSGEDAYTEAEILSFRASLRNSQGRFEEAVRLLDEVIGIYREARDRPLEGRSRIKKGMALGDGGRHEEAIREIRRGLSRFEVLEEPRLLISAYHNLVWYLNDSGRAAEALHMLGKTRSLYDTFAEPAHRTRLRWLEGKIARSLGHREEAEAAFKEARDAFLARGIGFDAALVALDLAVLCAERGQTGELKGLAAEMIPIFESRDVHQEALAALLLFRRSVEAETVTLGLLGDLARYLQRARHNPELRFTSGSES